MADDRKESGEARPSFDQLFDAYAAFVWRVLGRMGVQPKDVPDASQEVFLVVHRRLAEFEQRSSVKTWIYGICVRVAQKWYRKAARSREDDLDDLPLVDTARAADEELDWRRARAYLSRTLEELDSDQRQVFVLYEMENLPMPEVAAVLNCPLTTAYSRLYAARKQVRAAFARRKLSERSAS